MKEEGHGVYLLFATGSKQDRDLFLPINFLLP